MSSHPNIQELSGSHPFSPEVVETPWAFFRRVREECPVYRLPNGAYHIVSCYDDVMTAVMDTDTFSSNLVAVLLSGDEDGEGASPAMMDLAESGDDDGAAQATDVLAIADPPAHTRQRRVANRAFTMRRVQSMEDWIRRLCHELIDDFPEGEIDWVARFAVPLPMTIIIRLLGLPPEDMPRLKAWSDASVALLSGINTADELVEHGLKVNEMIGYLTDKYDAAYENPGDNLLGDLIREARADAEEFGRDEVVSMLVQLLTAGNETTTSLIGSAMMLMLQTDGLQATLRNDPSLVPNFIEEALRLESPFHGHFRVVTRDTELGGTPLKAGDRVMLLWSSANRDESHYEDVTEVRLDRERPKQHFAFGYGIHHCIGAHLARTEARIALEAMLERTSAIRLTDNNDFAHVPSLFVRSLRKLNIEVDKA